MALKVQHSVVVQGEEAHLVVVRAAPTLGVKPVGAHTTWAVSAHVGFESQHSAMVHKDATHVVTGRKTLAVKPLVQTAAVQLGRQQLVGEQIPAGQSREGTRAVATGVIGHRYV